MRVLLLILLFVIWESASGSPQSLVPPGAGLPLLLLGYGLLIAGMGLWGRRVARARPHTYTALGRRVDRFNLGMGVARGAVPAWFAVGVFVLGWRRTVDGLLQRTIGPAATDHLVTPGVVLGLLPGFVGWVGLWWSQYPVDRAVREQGVLAQLEADLPVFAPPPFASYLANKLRVQLLFTTVPVLLILLLRDTSTALFRTARKQWPSDGFDSAVSLGSVALVLLVVPAVLRHVLRTRRLPDGRLRQALADVLRLAGVRCRDVLLWDTHNNIGNAAVMGVLPRVRYVLLSDLLLESMTDEQVQAVFAHELGHVHHRHLAWFAGVLGSVMAALSVAGDWLADRVVPASADPSGATAITVQCAMGVTLAAVVWVGYGALSRWFERQADVYAVRLIGRAVSDGTATFAEALYRVSVVNNIPFAARNWTHGSMAARVAFLDRLAADPAANRRFDRRGRWVRVGLWIVMATSLGVVAVGYGRGLLNQP